ncbi:hypothetical protein [Thermococcus sp. 21S7]|uniref:hypothetical protein n=1 Tax=Thermococcus sp. 21S7 TaxID=1638221 RepID=UPI00143BC528|nr:hypothetical protein [Thermococcus sp. 21S7]NJE61552.1 hypothetical protein [Thermococcus sp. 21S7]
MKWKPLLVILLALIVSSIPTNGIVAAAYTHIDEGNGPIRTFSYGSMSTRAAMIISVDGEDPNFGAQIGNVFELSVGITPSIEENNCYPGSACFVPHNQKIVLQNTWYNPSDVEFVVLWVGDNSGDGLGPYKDLVVLATNWLKTLLDRFIPYASQILDSIKLLTTRQYEPNSYYGKNSITIYPGNSNSAGVILWVRALNYQDYLRRHPSQKIFKYKITAAASSDIYYRYSYSWVSGIPSKPGVDANGIYPQLVETKYVGRVYTSTTFEITFRRNL